MCFISLLVALITAERLVYIPYIYLYENKGTRSTMYIMRILWFLLMPFRGLASDMNVTSALTVVTLGPTPTANTGIPPAKPTGALTLRSLGPVPKLNFEVTRSSGDNVWAITKRVQGATEKLYSTGAAVASGLEATAKVLQETRETSAKLLETTIKTVGVATKQMSDALSGFQKSIASFQKFVSVMSAVGPWFSAISAGISLLTAFLPQPESVELQAIKAGFKQMDARFDRLEKILENVVDHVDAQFDRVQKRFDRLERKLDSIEKYIKSELDRLEERNQFHRVAFYYKNTIRIPTRILLKVQQDYTNRPNNITYQRFVQHCTTDAPFKMLEILAGNTESSEFEGAGVASAAYKHLRYDIQALTTFYLLMMNDAFDLAGLTVACFALEYAGKVEFKTEEAVWIKRADNTKELITRNLHNYVETLKSEDFKEVARIEITSILHSYVNVELTTIAEWRQLHTRIFGLLSYKFPWLCWHVTVFDPNTHNITGIHAAGRYELFQAHGKTVFLAWLTEKECGSPEHWTEQATLLRRASIVSSGFVYGLCPLQLEGAYVNYTRDDDDDDDDHVENADLYTHMGTGPIHKRKCDFECQHARNARAGWALNPNAGFIAAFYMSYINSEKPMPITGATSLLTDPEIDKKLYGYTHLCMAPEICYCPPASARKGHDYSRECNRQLAILIVTPQDPYCLKHIPLEEPSGIMIADHCLAMAGYWWWPYRQKLNGNKCLVYHDDGEVSLDKECVDRLTTGVIWPFTLGTGGFLTETDEDIEDDDDY